MDHLASALAHCRRDAKGLLKLSDLWAEAKAAHHGVSALLKRHPALSEAVIMHKGGCSNRGAFAPEGVARQLAKFLPQNHLWRLEASEAETSEVPKSQQPVEEVVAETGSANLTSINVLTSAGVLSELGALLQRDVTQLRNAGRILSVIDVAMAITGLARDQASKAVRELLRSQPEVRSKISNLKFPGRGQRDTPGAEIETIIEIVMLLPGAAAATTRCQAAKLLVRYIGADMKLVEELQIMKAAQSHLQCVPEEHRTPQEQAVRLCGEAVETQAPSTLAVYIPREPLIVRDASSVGLPGSDHLYAALRRPDKLVKLGTSRDVPQRMRDLSKSFEAAYELLIVWPHEACLEDFAHDILKPERALVGSSREHFSASISVDDLLRVVEAARAQYRLKMDLDASAFKRRREELEFQEELAERMLKRRRDEAQIKRDEMQINNEEIQTKLLHELVRQGDEEAKKVFLSSVLTRAKP